MAEGWRNVMFGGKQIADANSYGQRNARLWRWKGWHTGEDFRAPQGTQLNAPLSGTVVGRTTGGAYGNSILIKLDTGEYMRFAHLSKVAVGENGSRVKAGQYIGRTGGAKGTVGAGSSTGAHLHVEVMKRRGDGFVDPVAFLSGKKVSADVEKAPSGSSDTPDTTVVNETIEFSGTGGGTIKLAKFNKKDFYAMLESKFGNIDTLLKLDEEARAELGGKSLKWAIDEMVKKKVVNSDIMLTTMLQTAWFKKYSQQMTDRLVLERQRPDLFKTTVAESRAGIEAALSAKGVQVAPDVLDQLARNQYVYGWSIETVVDEAQKQEGALTYTGGEIAEDIAEIEQYADDFGVTLTEADLRKVRMDNLDNIGIEPTKEILRERAAQTYAVFADQIRKGQDTRSLAGAYFVKAAELLELSPDEIDWNDPLFTGGKAFTASDEKGSQVQKGLWDFEKEVRKDVRWLGTKNAREEAMGTAAGVLKTMGLA